MPLNTENAEMTEMALILKAQHFHGKGENSDYVPSHHVLFKTNEGTYS